MTDTKGPGKYKVLRGRHAEYGRVYDIGDIVDSRSDLDVLNSLNSQKFEYIGPGTYSKTSSTESEAGQDSLDSMTVAQLKELAEGEEIDLDGATRRDEILTIIKEAQSESLV